MNQAPRIQLKHIQEPISRDDILKGRLKEFIKDAHIKIVINKHINQTRLANKLFEIVKDFYSQ